MPLYSITAGPPLHGERDELEAGGLGDGLLAVAPRVRGQKLGEQRREGFGPPIGIGDAQLLRLAREPHLDEPREPNLGFGRALADQRPAASFLEVGEQLFDPKQVGLHAAARPREAHRLRDAVRIREVGGDGAERGVNRLRHRHDHLVDEVEREGGGVRRAGSAERVQHEAAGIVTPLDRDGAQKIGHARVDDPLDSRRRFERRQAERAGDVLVDRPCGAVDVDLEPAARKWAGSRIPSTRSASVTVG